MLVMLEQGVISIRKGEREVFHPVKGCLKHTAQLFIGGENKPIVVAITQKC